MQDDGSIGINAVKLKHGLGQIDPECSNLHVGDFFPLLGCEGTNMAQRGAVGVEPSTPSDECEPVTARTYQHMLPPSRPHISSIWQEAWTALDEAYGRTAPCAANLRLNGLLTDLVCSDVVTRQDKTPSRTCEVAQELSRYHERLRSRNSLSEQITLKGYLKLSEDAQQILGSMIALEMSGIVDNFAQIDFGRPDHHQAVLAAAGRAHRWITDPPGRPKRAHLNDYFEGATELFQQIPSADLTVSNHYDGRPQTPFETILHAGHRMIDRCVTYHATVKAYQRR